MLSTCTATGSQNSSRTQFVGAGFVGYLRNLKWVPIPLGVGFAYISYQQYRHIKKREQRKILGAKSIEDTLAKDWQVGIPVNFRLSSEKGGIYHFHFLGTFYLFNNFCDSKVSLVAFHLSPSGCSFREVLKTQHNSFSSYLSY